MSGHTRFRAAHRIIELWSAASEEQRAEWQDPSTEDRWHPDALRIALEREVPVRPRDDLSEREAALMAKADNRIGEFARWDHERLAAQLTEYDPAELELAGWTKREVKQLEERAGHGDAEDERDQLQTDYYAVLIVICEGEAHQREVLQHCLDKGWECRALI